MNTIIGDYCYAGIKENLSLFQNDENLFDKLDKFLEKHKDETKLLFISYDLKNKIESLSSNNSDKINFPTIRCIVPEKIRKAQDFNNPIKTKNKPIKFIPELNKGEYISIVKKIKNHIQQGDFYEANFCYEWHARSSSFNAEHVYQKLNNITNAPYRLLAELDHHQIVCASPELFIKKRGNKLYSSPIKGTQKRAINNQDDEVLKAELSNSSKEKAENVMIVDLVRNDLSKVAQPSSVAVDELCKVYTFKNIHQMISTISCEIDPTKSFSEIIKALFPMGSMTGAPKIRVMELMEKYENSKRGLYSGTIGIIHPNGDFDFNVIIRTIIYNKRNHLLSFHVGGAITANSIPEKEYEETLIKADALLKACQ